MVRSPLPLGPLSPCSSLPIGAANAPSPQELPSLRYREQAALEFIPRRMIGTILFANLTLMHRELTGYEDSRLFDFQSDFFEKVGTIVVDDYRGAFLVTMGTSALAVFESREVKNGHAASALRAALAIAAEGNFETSSERSALWNLAIGIHSGAFHYGFIGSGQNKSVEIGGAVPSIAQHIALMPIPLLERGSRILATQEALSQAQERFPSEFVGRFHLPGIPETVSLYSLS